LIFGPLPLAEAEGGMLAHALHLGGQRMAKGSLVDAAILAAASAAGLERLWVARLETGDVPEGEAAARIADAFAGPGIVVRAPVHGRVNLHASADGLLLVAADAVMQANRQSDAIAVSTLPPQTPVRSGDMVGTVKIIPYALPGAEMDSVLAAVLALPDHAIDVRPWQPGLRAILIQTRLPDTPDKLIGKTARVTAARLARLGIVMAQAPDVAHEIERLAEAFAEILYAAKPSALVLVAGGTATSDRRDVIPAAIVAAGGTLLRVGMPVDPGNLLVLGRLGSATVIGLPGCARSPKRNGLDLVLEQLAAGLDVTSDQVARMGVGGLLEESGRPVPWAWTG